MLTTSASLHLQVYLTLTTQRTGRLSDTLPSQSLKHLAMVKTLSKSKYWKNLTIWLVVHQNRMVQHLTLMIT